MCDINKKIEETEIKRNAELNEFRLNAINGLNDIELMLLRTRTFPGHFTRLQECGRIFESIIVNWQQVEPLIDHGELYGYHAGPKSMADLERMAATGDLDVTGDALIPDGRMVSYNAPPDNINPEAFITLRYNILRDDIPGDLQFMLECLQHALLDTAKYYKENPPGF